MDEETARRVLEIQGLAELELFEEAEDELARLDPDLEVAGVLRCDLLSRQSRWEEMRELAEGLARRSPESSQWWISWAYAVRRAESVEAAREILTEARKLHPTEAIIVYNLACYASVSGELQRARELLDEAIGLDPVCKEMAAKDDDLKALFRSSPEEGPKVI